MRILIHCWVGHILFIEHFICFIVPEKKENVQKTKRMRTSQRHEESPERVSNGQNWNTPRNKLTQNLTITQSTK